MFEHVDGYCERLAPGFWDEPLNAVTNLSFIIAALILWRLAKREGTALRPSFLIPTALLFLTGVGSFLFHTFANGWTGIADVAALALCLLLTIFFGGMRWLGQRWYFALVWPVIMVGLAFLLGAIVPVGGAFYLGPLVAGTIMAATCRAAGHPAWRWVAAAVIVFLPSFFFRTIDGAVCESFPYGTHFLWHILNGVVLGLAIRPLAWGDDGGHRDGAGRAAG